MTPNQPPSEPSRFARIRWPLIIVGMLSGHVGAMMLAVNVASGADGSGNGHSVLPSYYERAVHWDESRAALTKSAELGWKATIAPAIFPATDGTRSVVIQMADANGEPLGGLVVQASAWHHAVGEMVSAEAKAASPAGEGIYRLELPMRQAGMWDFEVTATRGENIFLSKLTVDIATTAPSSGPSKPPAAR